MTTPVTLLVVTFVPCVKPTKYAVVRKVLVATAVCADAEAAATAKLANPMMMFFVIFMLVNLLSEPFAF